MYARVHVQDVLVWRNQIYNIVINSFNGLPDLNRNLHQLGYKARDAPSLPSLPIASAPYFQPSHGPLPSHSTPS